MRVTIKNGSHLAKAIPLYGGIGTVKPGKKATFDNARPIPDHVLAALQASGCDVTIDGDEKPASEFADMTVEELETLALERDVVPETGTGKNGAVVKADLIAALSAVK
jgi:hypothetical protein